MSTNRRKFLQQFGKGTVGLVATNILSPVKGSSADIYSREGTTAAFNRKQSYIAPIYQELPLGAIKSKGWLLHQLKIMRDGTTGHLDEVYAKIKDDNGWLGGKGDGWEETPYWLDGATPLAYLLEDTQLQEKVLKYINWTLDHQRASGYFGPITKAEREKGVKITAENCDQGEDWWPKMVMLKVLMQYYTATNDERVIKFMTNYFQYQLKTLKQCPIGHWSEWAASRGAENVMIAQWLYSKTYDESLLKLAELIESQSFPWSDWFASRDWVINAAAHQDGDWMSRHGVNVSMALKSPAINYQRTKDKKYLNDLKIVFNDLMTLHGLPHGMFSADEDLHGNNPVQGVELCAIVETMFSLEQAIAITGDMQYMDALEKIAFNALPTQTTDDYNNKQYFQIANQVHVCKGGFNFSVTIDQMCNVFGMKSGYTCCLANMHQGWTKYTQHLWYGTPDNGLAALSYGPNEIKTKVGEDGVEISIHERTTYPFDETINFEISSEKEVNFPFHLRIPSWCKEASISLNGKILQQAKGGQIVKINRQWNNGDQLKLVLPMEVRVTEWGGNSRAIERGPLVYALKQEERWEKGHHAEAGDYYCIYPKGNWNYGLLEDSIKASLDKIKVNKVKPVEDNFIFNIEHAPIEIAIAAKKIPVWKIVNDVAPQPQNDRWGLFRGTVESNIETITLIPYGCSKLRVVAFPVVS